MTDQQAKTTTLETTVQYYAMALTSSGNVIRLLRVSHKAGIEYWEAAEFTWKKGFESLLQPSTGCTLRQVDAAAIKQFQRNYVTEAMARIISWLRENE